MLTTIPGSLRKVLSLYVFATFLIDMCSKEMTACQLPEPKSVCYR